MVGVSPGHPGKRPPKKIFKIVLKKCFFVFERVCSRRRGIRKWWAWAPGAAGKGPKNFWKVFLKKCFLGVYGAGEGELKNDGREPRGLRERAQNIFGKLFWKKKCFLRCYVAGEGEFENGGREPRERAPNKFLKHFWKNFVLKKYTGCQGGKDQTSEGCSLC